MWLIGQMLCHILYKSQGKVCVEFIMLNNNEYLIFFSNILQPAWSDYLVLLDLIRILYPDAQPLPEPDYRDFQSVVSIAAASNWYFLTTRVIPAIAASSPTVSLPQHQTPVALQLHIEYIPAEQHDKHI